MLSPMSDHYVLHVIRISDLNWEPKSHSKKPDLYVEVKLGEISRRTRTVKKDRSPTWDDTLTFPSSDASNLFVIQVKHKSHWSSDPCVGYIDNTDITLANLLDKCTDGEVQLSLRTPSGRTPTAPAGVIYLRLRVIDEIERADIDIKTAGQLVQQRGIVRSAGAADSTTVAVAEQILQSNEGDVLYEFLGSLFTKLDVFVGFIDDVSKIHPYLYAAWKVTSALYKSVSKQFKADRKVVGLVRTMERAFDFINDTRSLPEKTRSLEQTIIELLKQTTECCLFVRQYTRPGFIERMFDLGSEGKIDEFENSLSELKKALDSGNILYCAFVTARVSQTVNALRLREALNPSLADAFGRPMCLPGTRVKLQQQMVDLLLSEMGQNIFWLYGVAGSGKSTVSTTIAEYFRDIYRLGAFLIFERGKSEPSSVIRTIAYSLASFESSIATQVMAAIEKDSGITMASAASQFVKLLLGPLNAAAAAVRGPIVIVLDALDECGTPETRKELMRLFKEDFPKLPSNFRFLITSRPENDIVKALSRKDSVHEMELDYSSDSSRRDVLSYLCHEMHDIFEADSEVQVPEGWPLDANLAILGESADGLFIWASTAVKLVRSNDNPFGKLNGLVEEARDVSRCGLDALDTLYADVLRSSGISWGDDGSKVRFSKVLALLLLSKVPLSDKVIDGILGFRSYESSGLILSKLRCLLSYTPGTRVSLFHASFSDYLTSSKRTGDPWLIDISAQKWFLATRCFSVMEGMLHFSMCDLESSFVLNDDVPGLKKRIEDKIPPHLEYACVYWAQHLCDAPYSSDLLEKLSAFLDLRLLYWFEVLSLLKKFGRLPVDQALLDVSTWAAPSESVSSLLKDASRLAAVFVIPFTQSTPHIYVSALPLMRPESQVAAHYSKKTSSVVRIDRRGTKGPTGWIKVFEGHTRTVQTVAISSDGTRIASGSHDMTVRVWDAQTGMAVSEPFEGHTGYVNSVAFSPDGTRIISGSDDRTIRMWNVENGEVVCGPLEGHAERVWSVAFSKDGKRIVSGSKDKTIRVWDGQSGEAIFQPFEGHTDCVISVAFSPDGTRIISGSDDRTIRIWTVENGEVICGPLEGHTDEVWSVAFSNDGTRIVSGSKDKTIRIWDSQSGEAVSRPFEGHTEGVCSVAFSPDGKHVVSGSFDNTVRVWDVQSGEAVSEPFKGHTSIVFCVTYSPDGKSIFSGSMDTTIRVWDTQRIQTVPQLSEGHTSGVWSVAFSPDGRRILSGSWDKTIRVWDVQSGAIVSKPLEGHTDRIWSAAFSPDGTRIISGSRDKTIRVWDAQTGEAISQPFEGHTGDVYSVAFSPDGMRVVSGSADKTIRIWDVQSGKVISQPFEGHTRGVYSVAFSPDGMHVASGSDDNTIRVWDVQSGKIVSRPFEGHTAGVTSLAFSPDGTRIVSGSQDNTIRIWNVHNGDVVSGPFEGHTNEVWSVAYSPDGRRVVSGSDDRTIRVWNVENGEVVCGPLEGHTEEVGSVAFSKDGTRIVSGSADKTIRIWNAQTGRPVSGPSGEHMDGVTSRTHSSAGTRIVSGSHDKPVSVWDLEGGTTISETLKGCSDRFLPEDKGIVNWTLAENGWIRGEQGELLLWVPLDLRATLCYPQNLAVLSCAFSTKLDFEGAALGSRWQECFEPLR